MSDLIKRINDYIKSSGVGYLSIDLLEFINDEYNREKDKKSDEEARRMEEVDFHNLTTVHNIEKLWETLHPETVVRRGRKSKKSSPVNAEVLKTIKTSVEGIVTGFEALPNPDFIIGGYTIPDEITFEGKRKGRKSATLKAFSFPESFRVALNEEFAPKSEIVSTINTGDDIIDNPVVNSRKVLDTDQCDNDCHHVILYKKPVDPPKIKRKSKFKSKPKSVPDSAPISILKPEPIPTPVPVLKSKSDVAAKVRLMINAILDVAKTSSSSNCSSDNTVTTSSSSSSSPLIGKSDSTPATNSTLTPNDISDSSTTNPIPIPTTTDFKAPFVQPTTIDFSKFSKPVLRMHKDNQLVDRVDVFNARLRHSSTHGLVSKLNYNVNHDCVVGLVSSKPPVTSPSTKSEPESVPVITSKPRSNIPCVTECVISKPPPKIGTLTETLPFITPRLESILAAGPKFKPVVKPGRPLGSPNKTPEQKEQERLNKKPVGRPLGSGNKKATSKKDEEVIIYDREIPLRINPNKFEIHLIQYTLENPHVSYAEWSRHAMKTLDKVREENKESSRQRLNAWSENIMREINRVKGRMSLGSGKGKVKVLYEPDEYMDKETLEYKYELLETRKNDPFFVSLLRKSFELRSSSVSGSVCSASSSGSVKSSRKSRFDNIGSLSTFSDYGIYADSYGNNSVIGDDYSSERGMFVADLIDLSDINDKPVSDGDGEYDINGLNIDESYIDDLLEEGDNSDIINELLDDFHGDNSNNTAMSDDVKMLCLNTYQCVYDVYNMLKN